MTQTIIIAAIVFISILIVSTIIDIIKRKKKNKTYVSLFESTYQEHSVLETLNILQTFYRPKSMEYLVIEKAKRYLVCSILKDYQTAFAIIEDVFDDKSVSALHDTVLIQEKNKVIYLIEKGD